MEAQTLPAIEAPDAKVRAVLAVLDTVLGETYNQLADYPGLQGVILQMGMAINGYLENGE